MANKDLFKQAIAEAKSVREAAIANAKQSLEESLTPHLKDMLAAKLQELEGSEEVIAEEGLVAESDLGFSEAAEDDSEESEDDAAAAEDAPEGEEAPEGEMGADEDKEVSDLSVEDFKTLIRDIIAQEMGAGAPQGEEIPGEEMPAGDDLEGPAPDVADGEEIDLEELLKELEGMGASAKEEGAMSPEAEAGPSKETQIAELEAKLTELRAGMFDNFEGWKKSFPQGTQFADENGYMMAKDAKGAELGKWNAASQMGSHADDFQYKSLEEKEEKGEEDNSPMMNEALETIESLKKDLTEVNLLNAKLLYLNKVLKANNLSETQQVNVIAAFDKAETVKEVKLVFETICESLVIKKETNPIKESRGFASKATGTTASNPGVISEVSETVRRMQKLAGII
jgi:hypothetical protein